jgi:hypothetical protein
VRIARRERSLRRVGSGVEAANDASCGEIVRGMGAEHVPYRSTLPFHSDESWAGDEIDALRLFLDDAIAMLPQLRAAYDGDRPDLFLYDIAGGPARLLATDWGVPAVQLSPTFVAWDGYEDDMAETVAAMKADPRPGSAARAGDVDEARGRGEGAARLARFDLHRPR